MATHTPVAGVEESIHFRLIIFSPEGNKVLLKREDCGHKLPTITVPRYSRLAQTLATMIRDAWNLTVLLLFSSGDSDPAVLPHVVLEACGNTCPTDLEWRSADSTAAALPSEERDLFLVVRENALGTKRSCGLEPFGRLGWLHELREWIHSVVGPGRTLTGFEQVNGTESFALIRFDTNRGAVWFKAVGRPLLHEYSITLGLSAAFPGFLPSVLGSIPQWNGWLMEDCGGMRLDRTSDTQLWSLAARTLAQMQIRSLANIEQLKNMGCRKLTTSELPKLLKVYIQLMRELMPQQTSTSTRVLSSTELADLESILGDCCERADRSSIPPALVHGDFKGGNLQVSKDRCLFIDWAQASIGYPFANLEHLLALCRKNRPNDGAACRELTETYAGCWREFFSETAVTEACLVMPTLGLLMRILPEFGEYSAKQVSEPRFGSYMRSMTRRIWVESKALAPAFS